jgi:uncharacterized coiled-coil protein SlyX
MNQDEHLRAVEADALKDLEQRLARLRARMAADGRDAAIEALDRAIAREARSTAKEATGK